MSPPPIRHLSFACGSPRSVPPHRQPRPRARIPMDNLGNDDDDDDSSDSSYYDSVIDEQEIFIRHFHRGDSDLEFDNALSFVRAESVPTVPIQHNSPPSQASYNKPENWKERNRRGLMTMVARMQGSIDTCSVCINMAYNYYHVDDFEPIVWHEPILTEYWSQLKATIDRKKQQLGIVIDIKMINIENVELKKECMAALVAILSSGGTTISTRYVEIDNANLCAEGIIWLSKLVDVHVELQTLTIIHNRIHNTDSARCLSMSLKSHTCINHLSLGYCDLGSSPEVLLALLQSDVEYINIENNNIDSLGAAKIAEYLESDPPIKHLSLAHNLLNDDDIMLISQALKRNKKLRRIDLRSNNITSVGVKALLTCVFDGSSLNAISESNHTLGRMDMFSGYLLEDCIGCIERMLSLDRKEKIVLSLQDKDSLLQYLANVPVELIPEILAFPHGRVVDEHYKQRKLINIVYLTMRWWNMPMLYSYYQCVMTDANRKIDP